MKNAYIIGIAGKNVVRSQQELVCDKVCCVEHQIVIKNWRSKLNGAMGSYMLHQLKVDLKCECGRNRWQDL